jgi:hypothetical protein
MFQYQWMLDKLNCKTTGGLKEEETQEANGEVEPI